MRAPIAALFACLLLAGCRSKAPAEPEPAATSLLGWPLMPIEIEPGRRAELEAGLERARAHERESGGDEAAIVWVGRRQAYLGDYQGAVETFTRGLELHPQSFELLRHRGHRYITLRQLDRAVDDLALATARMIGRPDEPEPDGAPNALGVPRSTKQGNVWYHLALAHYLRGEFALAADAWSKARALATNDDMRVAVDYWLYLALRRSGRDEDADRLLVDLRRTMDVIENHDYHRLLLHFKGELSERELLIGLDEGTVAHETVWYGYGAGQLIAGEPERARAIFERVVHGAFWPAFGYIAAEAELARSHR